MAATAAVAPPLSPNGTLTRRRSASAASSVKKGRAGQQKGSHFMKDGISGKTSRLAQVLMARLAYANLKVNQGWIKQNIDEVEHLYSSRFKVQAEQRRSRQAAARATIPSAIAGEQTRTNQELSSSLEGAHSSFPVQQLLSQSQLGTAGHNPPPRRPFADDADDGSPKLSTTRVPSNHYLGYTPSFYTGYDEATGETYPIQTSQQSGYPPQPPLYVETSNGDRQAVTSPSHHQASHSMYSYLASPVAPSITQFANSAQDPNLTASKASVQAASAALHAQQQQSWNGAGQNNQIELINSHPIASSTYVHNPEYREGPGVMITRISAGPYQVGAQDPLVHYPIAPVPAITPRPDQSAPTFASIVPTASKPPRMVQHPHTRAEYGRGHNRNPSLRGEYSVSNVTMDDLDSHFGQ